MPRVVHFEITADDPDRATTFYHEVFGWNVQKWEGPQDYWLLTTGGAQQPGIDGAIMRRGESPFAAPVINTIDVSSVDEFVAKVEAAGGTVVAPKMEVPGIGHMAYCRDTEGNTFGIMQLDQAAR